MLLNKSQQHEAIKCWILILNDWNGVRGHDCKTVTCFLCSLFMCVYTFYYVFKFVIVRF